MNLGYSRLVNLSVSGNFWYLSQRRKQETCLVSYANFEEVIVKTNSSCHQFKSGSAVNYILLTAIYCSYLSSVAVS